MRKFSSSWLGIISESDNIFRIRVIVSDLNSEFRIFFQGQFGQFQIFSWNSELYAEKIWKFIKILFFHENIVFLIRKSPNTLNSIFRANIRNLLLRAPYPWYIYIDPPPNPWYFDPLSMVFLTP